MEKTPILPLWLLMVILFLVGILAGCNQLEIIEPNMTSIEINQEEKEVEEVSEKVEETKPVEEIQEEPKETIQEEIQEEDDKEVVSQEKEVSSVNSSLSKEEVSWSFKRNTNHEPVTGYYKVDIKKYDTYFIASTQEKVMYLTFDEGYEYGFTGQILDTLKEQNVQAAFFVTKYFIDSNPELVKRMVKEGHVVANHSATHPAFSRLSKEKIKEELEATAKAFETLTGKKMDFFFRPPEGKYSEEALYHIKEAGYKTVFWSMAYKDWDVNNQPGRQVAYDHVLANHHKGAIILLHAVSKSNTEALGDILKDLKSQGYRFGSLYELP